MNICGIQYVEIFMGENDQMNCTVGLQKNFILWLSICFIPIIIIYTANNKQKCIIRLKLATNSGKWWENHLLLAFIAISEPITQL